MRLVGRQRLLQQAHPDFLKGGRHPHCVRQVEALIAVGPEKRARGDDFRKFSCHRNVGGGSHRGLEIEMLEALGKAIRDVSGNLFNRVGGARPTEGQAHISRRAPKQGAQRQPHLPGQKVVHGDIECRLCNRHAVTRPPANHRQHALVESDPVPGIAADDRGPQLLTQGRNHTLHGVVGPGRNWPTLAPTHLPLGIADPDKNQPRLGAGGPGAARGKGETAGNRNPHRKHGYFSDGIHDWVRGTAQTGALAWPPLICS